ncbi:hypothetical protein LCGC14_2158720, partial [marine sediment metagenome]
INEMDIMLAANRAALLGIPVDELENLMAIARAAATATGESVQKMFNDIVVGIGRASPMILDNLGIVIKIETATAEYAATIGKTAAELTDAEKKQALLNAVLVSGEDIMRKVGEAGKTVTDVERWQQVTAVVADLRAELGQALLPVMNQVFTVLTETLRGWVEQLSELNRLTRAVRALEEGSASLNQELIAEKDALNDLLYVEDQLNQAVEDQKTLLFAAGLAWSESLEDAALELQAHRKLITAKEFRIKTLEVEIRALQGLKETEEDLVKTTKTLTEADKLYIKGLEAMKDIIQGNRTEYERLADTLVFLQSFNWPESETFALKLQADAIDIIIRKMIVLMNLRREAMGLPPGRWVAGTGPQLTGPPLPPVTTDGDSGGAAAAAAGGGAGAAVLQSLAAAFMQIESLAMVLDPLTTIFEAMAAVLEPLINTALAPLVGLLIAVGQELGRMFMPVIEALTPILQDLVSVVASLLMPVFILLAPIISIVTAALEVLGPIIQMAAVFLDFLMRPVQALAIVIGAIISWLVALGKVIGYIVTFQWGKIGTVVGGPSAAEIARRIAAVFTRPPLEFGERAAELGGYALEGEPGFEVPGGGGIPSTTTIQRAPDIYVTIHIENIYGAGGAEQAGMDIARVLREHALAGGQI